MPDTRKVFELRRSGKYNEALELSRELIKISPNDEWTIKAYGWSLISKIEIENDIDTKQSLIEELQKLDLADKDELLSKKLKTILSPFGKMIIEASQLSKAQKKHKEARSIIINILKKDPENQDALLTLGWILFRMLSTDIQESKNQYLLEFAKVFNRINIDKILLGELIIRISTDIAGNSEYYPTFIKDCILDYIPIIDKFEKENILDIFINADSETKILSKENVIKGLYKNLKRFDKNKMKNAEWIINCINEWGKNKFQNEWTPYYYGRLLCWCGGDLETALKSLIPIARKSPNEYWIWSAIAETQHLDNLKISCYCKSISANAAKETMKKDIYLKLAVLWEMYDNYSEASYCVDKCAELYSIDSNSQPESLIALINSSWYISNAMKDEDFLSVIEFNSKFVDDILISDLPILPANYIKTDYNKEKEKYYHEFFTSEGVSCKLRTKIPLDLILGEAVSVRVISDSVEKNKVIWWGKRNAPLWDQLKEELAVVVFKNEEFLLASFSMDNNTIIYFDNDSKANEMKIGDILSVRVVKNNKDKYNTVTWTTASKNQLPDFCRIFQGSFTFSENGPHGFVYVEEIGEIFVAPNLIQEFSEDEVVSGLAIYQKRKTIKRSNSYGWKAILVN